MATKKSRTPGAERASALEAATQLMAEREKYEQWLDDLEAKKDTTPAKVFDRVRQDYLARLQTVMEQLGEHTTLLQEHAETLVAKLRELEEAEEENEEEQAEAALRKQVGEMTSAEWESGSRKAQRELAKIKENQLVILADLNRIRDLLGGDDEDADEPAKTSADFNELEFLSSVVGTETPSSPPRAPPVPTRKPTPPAAPAAVSAAPRTPAAPPPPPAAPPPPPPAATAPPRVSAESTQAPARQTPSASQAPQAPRPYTPTPAARSSAETPAPAAAAEPPTSTEVPAPRPSGESPSGMRTLGAKEQPKTLKCTECGSMNYPSEWYCERCGAELTVV